MESEIEHLRTMLGDVWQEVKSPSRPAPSTTATSDFSTDIGHLNDPESDDNVFHTNNRVGDHSGQLVAEAKGNEAFT